jgi:hypothetical protein
MLTIACVLRSGGKVGYDASWVEKLHNMLKRNVTREFELVCLSDVDVPCRRIPLDSVGSGYWAKLQLFKPAQFCGPVLFFDLDTVICNNIDPLIDKLLSQQNFVMWHDDWYNLSSSAIMFWNGDYSHIYQSYINNPDHYHDQYSAENQGPQRLIGDQAVISTLTPHVFVNNFVPPEWIHVVSKDDTRYNLDQCRILIFRKTKSKPSTHPNHVLVKEHWH